MAGEIIREGDPTSHGGTVLEGSPMDICHGKPIAYVGHKVKCPKCKGIFPIVEGVLTTTFYGKGVAIAGMKTACGASLIATQFTDIVEYSSGATGTRSDKPQGSANDKPFTAPNASASVAGMATQTKAIKRVFWTYGANELPLDEASRHYVDLNLHLETENYAPGETALVVIENDDGSDLISGSQTMQLQAVVGPDGSAKLMNVFKNKTVEIGVIS